MSLDMRSEDFASGGAAPEVLDADRSIDEIDDADGFDPEDISSNDTTGPAFADVLRSRLSRRSVLAGGFATAAGFLTSSIAGGAPAVAYTGSQRGRSRAQADQLLGFRPVPLSNADEVVVPEGYTARVLVPWGTPIVGSYPAFVPGGNTAEQQAQQMGMDHDGMHYFPLQAGPAGSEHGLLVLNHENTDEGYLHTGARATRRPRRTRSTWCGSRRPRTGSRSWRSRGTHRGSGTWCAVGETGESRPTRR